MTEEMKLLLKLMLAQEEGHTEAGQNQRKSPSKKRKLPQPVAGLDTDPTKAKAETGEKQSRADDFDLTRRELYDAHTNNISDMKEVPIWAKYALTVPEAAKYFHLGENKLREIIRRDKYANYLIWNGGRVYIKRKLFEEFLDNETEV